VVYPLSGTICSKARAGGLLQIGKKKKRKKLEKRLKGLLPAGEPRAKPEVKVRPYDAHVLLCGGGDCKKRGSKEVRKVLKAELRAAGLNRDVRVDSVDCLGFCKHGPNAVVYGPNGHGGTWYLGLDEGKVPEVVSAHLKEGRPAGHLAAEYRPRKGAS